MFQAVRTKSVPDLTIPTDECFKTVTKKVPKPSKDEVVKQTRSRFQVLYWNYFAITYHNWNQSRITRIVFSVDWQKYFSFSNAAIRPLGK
jgi:hypothetical protein